MLRLDLSVLTGSRACPLPVMGYARAAVPGGARSLHEEGDSVLANQDSHTGHPMATPSYLDI